MKNVAIRIALCAVFLMVSQQGSFAQWKQCKGFENAFQSNNVDAVAGFLTIGNDLFANGKCGYSQPGATGDSLFRSTDNGQTWTSFSSNGGMPLVAFGNVLIGNATLPSSAPNTGEVLFVFFRQRAHMAFGYSGLAQSRCICVVAACIQWEGLHVVRDVRRVSANRTRSAMDA